MRITDVRSMRLSGPRPHSVGGAESTIGKWIVRVDTDAGIHGLGEAEDFMGVGEAIAHIKPHLVGRSPFQIRSLVSEILYGTLPPHTPEQRSSAESAPTPLRRPLVPSMSPTATPTGPIVWGLSGVEIALCDLAGKALQIPVYQLLGGAFRDRVRVYLDRSSPPDSDDLSAWKRMGEEAVEQGFPFIKFDAEHTAPEWTGDCWNRSLSPAQINRIVERIGAVREVVGPEVEICLDCHWNYNASDAVRLARALAHLDLFWLEDPTSITNLDAFREVRSRSPIPICGGEMFSAPEMRLFVDQGAFDIVHPDVIFCGGIHETVRIGSYAELHSCPTALHGNGGSLAAVASAHAASAIRTLLGIEFHHIETDWIVNMVRREGVPLFEDGHIRLTDAPGLGVELDREICERYLVEGEPLY